VNEIGERAGQPTDGGDRHEIDGRGCSAVVVMIHKKWFAQDYQPHPCTTRIAPARQMLPLSLGNEERSTQ
jgi:hypothetical protein